MKGVKMGGAVWDVKEVIEIHTKLKERTETLKKQVKTKIEVGDNDQREVRLED
jgi:hypothetical protein